MNTHACKCGSLNTWCTQGGGVREDTKTVSWGYGFGDGYLKPSGIEGGPGLYCTESTSRCDHGPPVAADFALGDGSTHQVSYPGNGIHTQIVIDGYSTTITGDATAIATYEDSNNDLKVLPTLSGGGENRLFIVKNGAVLEISFVRLSHGSALVLYNNLVNDIHYRQHNVFTKDIHPQNQGGLILLGPYTGDLHSCPIGIHSKLTANHVAFVGGVASFGGAIAYTASNGPCQNKKVSLILNDCSIVDNLAIDHGGGGVYMMSYGDAGVTVKIKRTLIYHNHCRSFGGGICLALGSQGRGQLDLEISHSTFQRNTVGKAGGGLELRLAGSNNNIQILNTNFQYNYVLGSIGSNINAQCGAGLLWGGGKTALSFKTALIENCTFTDNMSADWGGGICLKQKMALPLSLKNVVLARNSANRGGALYMDNGDTLKLHIWNMIVRNNWARAQGGGFLSNYGAKIYFKDSLSQLQGNVVNPFAYNTGYELDQIKDGGLGSPSLVEFDECKIYTLFF